MDSNSSSDSKVETIRRRNKKKYKKRIPKKYKGIIINQKVKQNNFFYHFKYIHPKLGERIKWTKQENIENFDEEWEKY